MKNWLSRRRFLGRSLGAAAAAAGWSVSDSAWADEDDANGNGPRLTRVAVEVPHLPEGLDGFRIAQISDLHLEPYTKPSQIERMVKACNAIRPDMVAMTGDFVTYSARPAGLLGEILSGLKANHGVFASLGNHDFQSGHEHVQHALRERKITVLRNETTSVHTDGGELRIAGMDSRYVAEPNLPSSLRGWKPGQPLVVLMHEPDVADDLAASKVEALQLSGHTHGGQLRFLGMQPSVYRRARWGKKYLAGAYSVGSMQLYVNRGIGCVGVPLRVKCPAELTEITLLSPNTEKRKSGQA